MQFRQAFAGAVVLAFGAVVAAPLVGGAVAFGATCYGSNGETEYVFDGLLEAVPAHETSFQISAYEAEFKGADPTNENAVPLEDADNDVHVELLDNASRAVMFAHHSPDTIDYFTPYREKLGWGVQQNRMVQGRFTAAFDKRGEPDAHCQAVTVAFTMEGHQTNGVGWVCDKAGSTCNLIKP